METAGERHPTGPPSDGTAIRGDRRPRGPPVPEDYSAAAVTAAAAASGLAAVSGSVGEASAGFSSPPSAAAGGSSAFTSASAAFGFSASASLAPSAVASAGLASSEVPSSAAFSPSAGSAAAAAAPSSAASSDSFLVFLNEKPLSLKEGFLKEKRFFFCFASSLVDGVPSSGLAEASPFVAAGSLSPLTSATSAFSPSSFGASSVGVLPLAVTSALLASSAAGEVSPLVLAWPFSWRNTKIKL
ncbi:hypothetical protein EYF80_051697 [Liparis tanakae]|uniref:Uncharacterized protein n=1 Tax=Liparis tanakae TaxID=230148 RepID=A0A4Z2FB25_9TELE|nr:hypothetical protein EYF80_051697 [Liparis tanakae]